MPNSSLNNPRCAVIANYFGCPPSYFQLWLDSCSYNPGITWLFFTDIDMSAYDVPNNVKVIQTNIKELKRRFQSKLNYPVKYQTAWQFCALRPGLGVFFEEELKDFDYWGWCDCDTIWGDLNPCIESCKRGADKILPKGHLSFVRNDRKFNRAIFNSPLSRQAWESGHPGLPCFDEEAVPKVILPSLGAEQDNAIPFVNLRCRSGNYVLEETTAVYSQLGVSEGVRLPFVMTWRDGRLVGHFAFPDREVKRIDLAYAHFFRRDLSPEVERLKPGCDYLIVPNKIIDYDGHELGCAEICHLDRWRFHWSYFKKRMNWKTFRRKLHI